MTQTVKHKQFWAEGSGLLPIHLTPVLNKEQYIMLDGGLYDFCLDLTEDDLNPDSFYSAAWSSDVKNYIAIQGDDIIVYNWCKKQKEKVATNLVQDKFQSFLKILYSNSYRTSDDIAPFILGIFAQLRNLTKERQEPEEALNLLFKLLITLQEESSSWNEWDIQDVYEPIGFANLQDSIRKGVRGIHPKLDYILRHGSGPLFETANREAVYFDSQLNLFGEFSKNIRYASQRKYTGIHYTPRYLVRSIVENVLKGIDLTMPKLSVLDPACGSGTFLQEVLKQLREKQYQGELILKGFDNSAMAVQTSKFLLNYENRTQWNKRVAIDIRRTDSLSDDWGNNDVILMNPPFVSAELIKDEATKDAVNTILDDVRMKKRPNMAAAFYYKAIQALNNDGIIGAVLPSSLLVQEQYFPLREISRQIMNLETVAQLGNFVFSEALTDTSFLIARKHNNTPYSIPLNIWCRNSEQSAHDAMRGWRQMQYDNASERIKDNYNIYIPIHFPMVKKTWKVLPKEDNELINLLTIKRDSRDLKLISEIFEIRQGIIRGNHNLFEIGEDEYHRLSKKEKKMYRPVATSQTIMSGYTKEGIYIWYPYSRTGLIVTSEEELKEFEWSYNWLLPHKKILQTRTGVNHWWELTRPRIETFGRNESLLCSKRFGGSHSFAITPEHYVVEEGNIFLFKNNNYLEEDKYFYLSFFSSTLFQRMLAIYARPLMAGYDLGKIQIKDIPIIDVAKSGIRNTESYIKLVSFGKDCASGYAALRNYIDQYVFAFYK